MMQREPISDNLNQIAKHIVDAAFNVHFSLGPGLLESVYEVCLEYELTKRGLKVDRQVDLPVVYEDIQLEAGFRLDLLVNESVILELKAVENLLPVHTAQIITYLKLSKRRLGFLINFNVPLIKDGIKRIAV
ncbi:GxxExxY protein [Oscillatoriales cyanobacterium USR001]|nr:GxxExxY protein [Oscillatoriales cyanobacterium USR001]